MSEERIVVCHPSHESALYDQLANHDDFVELKRPERKFCNADEARQYLGSCAPGALAAGSMPRLGRWVAVFASRHAADQIAAEMQSKPLGGTNSDFAVFEQGGGGAPRSHQQSLPAAPAAAISFSGAPQQRAIPPPPPAQQQPQQQGQLPAFTGRNSNNMQHENTSNSNSGADYENNSYQHGNDGNAHEPDAGALFWAQQAQILFQNAAAAAAQMNMHGVGHLNHHQQNYGGHHHQRQHQHHLQQPQQQQQLLQSESGSRRGRSSSPSQQQSIYSSNSTNRPVAPAVQQQQQQPGSRHPDQMQQELNQMNSMLERGGGGGFRGRGGFEQQQQRGGGMMPMMNSNSGNASSTVLNSERPKDQALTLYFGFKNDSSLIPSVQDIVDFLRQRYQCAVTHCFVYVAKYAAFVTLSSKAECDKLLGLGRITMGKFEFTIRSARRQADCDTATTAPNTNGNNIGAPHQHQQQMPPYGQQQQQQLQQQQAPFAARGGWGGILDTPSQMMGGRGVGGVGMDMGGAMRGRGRGGAADGGAFMPMAGRGRGGYMQQQQQQQQQGAPYNSGLMPILGNQGNSADAAALEQPQRGGDRRVLLFKNVPAETLKSEEQLFFRLYPHVPAHIRHITNTKCVAATYEDAASAQRAFDVVSQQTLNAQPIVVELV